MPARPDLAVRWSRVLGLFPAGIAKSAPALRALLFMQPRDIGLFLRSARTDAAIAQSRDRVGEQHAFDAAYAAGDPWASGDRRYLYQRRKYDVLTALLPPGRRFERVLDLGTGLGLLGRRIAGRAEEVLGLDISQNAVNQARLLHADVANLRFERGDVRDLPTALDGSFDLVVLADTLYYLPPPLSDEALKAIALRVATLLAPGGLCLLANHYFFAADPDSRLSRRIHRAFAWSPGFHVVSEHRRPFYLVSLLEEASVVGQEPGSDRTNAAGRFARTVS